MPLQLNTNPLASFMVLLQTFELVILDGVAEIKKTHSLS